MRPPPAPCSIRAPTFLWSRPTRASWGWAKGDRRTRSGSAPACSSARTRPASSTCGSSCTGATSIRPGGKRSMPWARSIWRSGTSGARLSASPSIICWEVRFGSTSSVIRRDSGATRRHGMQPAPAWTPVFEPFEPAPGVQGISSTRANPFATPTSSASRCAKGSAPTAIGPSITTRGWTCPTPSGSPPSSRTWSLTSSKT